MQYFRVNSVGEKRTPQMASSVVGKVEAPGSFVAAADLGRHLASDSSEALAPITSC